MASSWEKVSLHPRACTPSRGYTSFALSAIKQLERIEVLASVAFLFFAAEPLVTGLAHKRRATAALQTLLLNSFSAFILFQHSNQNSTTSLAKLLLIRCRPVLHSRVTRRCPTSTQLLRLRLPNAFGPLHLYVMLICKLPTALRGGYPNIWTFPSKRNPTPVRGTAAALFRVDVGGVARALLGSL